jgi:formylglycine-generating enzyme required for sulfatase activity
MTSSQPVELVDCSDQGTFCTTATTTGRELCTVSELGSASQTWISVTGGSFQMGPRGSGVATTVADFEMLSTEVTLAQYLECVDAGPCEPPERTGNCDSIWGNSAQADWPVTCVGADMAVEYCRWVGGRLPSEAEWEYALRNRGSDVEYPWGDAKPCLEVSASFCSVAGPLIGCSIAVDTTEQGICDLVDNVTEWALGSGPTTTGSVVVRGGESPYFVGSLRDAGSVATDSIAPNRGFRCVR